MSNCRQHLKKKVEKKSSIFMSYHRILLFVQVNETCSSYCFTCRVFTFFVVVLDKRQTVINFKDWCHFQWNHISIEMHTHTCIPTNFYNEFTIFMWPYLVFRVLHHHCNSNPQTSQHFIYSFGVGFVFVVVFLVFSSPYTNRTTKQRKKMTWKWVYQHNH